MSTHDAANTPGGTGTEIEDVNDKNIREIQELRRSFIRQVAKEGNVPNDPEDRQFLIAMMNQTTSTAIAGKRIKADEKNTKSNAEMVQNLAEVIRIASANASASHRKKMIASNRDVPEMPVSLVEGHTDIGFHPISTAGVANMTQTAKQALDDSSKS